MSLEHLKLIRLNRDRLVTTMDPIPILTKLLSKEVLTQRDYEQLSNEQCYSRSERVEHLLDKLILKSDRAFPELIRALCETEPKHVATKLMPELGWFLAFELKLKNIKLTTITADFRYVVLF